MMNGLVQKVRGVYQRCTGEGVRSLRGGGLCTMMKMTRTGVVTAILRTVIAVELVVLGVGVVRRLEDSEDLYDRATETARMELAVLEARELQQEIKEGAVGFAGIGAAGSSPTQVKKVPADTSEAPEIRPRSVAAIISEDTGDIDAATAALEREAGTEGASRATQEEPGEEKVQSTGGEKKVDELIRRGVAAMISGDMKRCVLYLEQARAIEPEHPAMLYYYGMAYDKLLNPHKARDYYGKLFGMRERAGKYFTLASRRLTYGVEQPDALRGKLAFGPQRLQHTFDTEQGECVNIILPVMLAPGEHIRPDDIYIAIQFFELVNGRKIDFARHSPKLSWVNEKPAWNDCEEDLLVNYNVPVNEETEDNTAAEVKYYGYTAKLYYQGEPLDCISEPAALILHEQRLNSRRRSTTPGGLLPDDGLIPTLEEAVPYSDVIKQPDETDI